MKAIAIFLIVCSFITGIVSDNLDFACSVRPLVAFAFVLFLSGIFILMKLKNESSKIR